MKGFALVGIVIAYYAAISGSVDWSTDYAGSLDAARQASRPLLVVLESPAADERLEAIRRRPDAEETRLLRAYQVCRIDVSTAAGRQVASEYGASELPCTVITDRDCRQIAFRGVGQFGPADWKSTLRAHTGAGAPAVVREPTRPFAHRDLKAAVRASHRSGKPLLVLVTMPGCAYCEKMKAETFSRASIRNEIARHYESVIVDTRDEPDWVRAQSVQLFPTTLFFDPDGNAVARIDGFADPPRMREKLEVLGMVPMHF